MIVSTKLGTFEPIRGFCLLRQPASSERDSERTHLVVLDENGRLYSVHLLFLLPEDDAQDDFEGLSLAEQDLVRELCK